MMQSGSKMGGYLNFQVNLALNHMFHCIYFNDIIKINTVNFRSFGNGGKCGISNT